MIEIISIMEADTGKPTRFVVRVIEAGVSKNRNSYPQSVLKDAVPLFEGVRVFDKTDAEHIKGEGKAARNIIGRLSSARYDEASQSIVAVLHALDSAPITARMVESVQKGMRELFQFSIDAIAQTRQIAGVREAVKFIKVNSLDLVVDASAGGELIRLVEAELPNQEPDMRNKLIAMLVAAGKNKEQLDALSDDDLMGLISAMREAKPEAKPADPQPAGLDAAAINKLIEAAAAKGYARHAIASAQLPEQAKAKLQKHVEQIERLSEACVDTLIKDEQVYLGHFVEAGKINLPRIEAGKTNGERKKDMLDDFFKGDGSVSIREAYIEFTGDKGVSGRLAQCDIARMAEATGTLREAVNSGTFANALGDSITRQMMAEYQLNPLFNDWEWLCDVVPVRDFRTQERVQMGGYGNLPAVAQSAAYLAFTTPSDVKATYAATKRGGLETVSLEAIANDDVGLLRRIPVELATAAGMTLYEFVYGFVLGNGLIYDGLALFAGGHNNTGVAALSAASFSAARLALMKQTKPGSAKALGLIAKHLVVPPELEETAYDLFVRASNNDETFTQSRKPTVHVCASATDTNNWYLTADKRQIPQLEIGFYGSRTPELFIQDTPNLGSMFANDVLTYKIRHIYGGTVKDFRGLYGSIVA